jgi:hypothetical protein
MSDSGQILYQLDKRVGERGLPIKSGQVYTRRGFFPSLRTAGQNLVDQAFQPDVRLESLTDIAFGPSLWCGRERW